MVSFLLSFLRLHQNPKEKVKNPESKLTLPFAVHANFTGAQKNEISRKYDSYVTDENVAIVIFCDHDRFIKSNS